MLKILLFPFVVAVVGAIILGSFGVMKDQKAPANNSFGWVMFGLLVLGGIAAEIYGAVLFDRGGQMSLAFLLLILGLMIEVIALVVAAIQLFFSLTPVVAGEMDRLQVTPKQRTAIRETAWKHWKRFQKT